MFMDIQIFKDIMRTFIFLVCHCHKNHLIKPLLSWTAVIICLWYAMQVHVCDWLGDSSQAPATWFVKWNNYYIFYLDIPYPALVHSITKWNFFLTGLIHTISMFPFVFIEKDEKFLYASRGGISKNRIK